MRLGPLKKVTKKGNLSYLCAALAAVVLPDCQPELKRGNAQLKHYYRSVVVQILDPVLI